MIPCRNFWCVADLRLGNISGGSGLFKQRSAGELGTWAAQVQDLPEART
jgi:hypothetical protein